MALASRLPALYGFREFTEAGGLMSYGASFATGFRRSAHLVDKVLKGANPVEQPTHFELVLNVKTLNALGIEMPPILLTNAEGLVE